MRLGIVVTTERHGALVRGIAEAALRRGHSVGIFATDRGVLLLADPRFSSLGTLPGVAMSFCGHSARRHGGPPAGLPATVVEGSQLDNALLAASADKLLAF